MNKKNYIFTIVVCLSICLRGQNLVKNPSFEEFEECPKKMGNIGVDVLYWGAATEGTTDYFNVCSSFMGVPKNFNGSQNADFGKGYAGLYFLAPNDYREYLQGELSQTLEKGQHYKLSFYLNLADKSTYAIKKIGVLFAKNKIEEEINQPLNFAEIQKEKNVFNYIEIDKNRFLSNKKKWMYVSTEIVANGDENYIVLGNFKNNKSTVYYKMHGVKGAAYYYIDNVTLEKTENTNYEDLVLDKTYVFDRVFFSTDEFKLNSKAKIELDKLYKELKSNPEFYITVHAHTDADGTHDYNKILSRKRAKSVAAYLVSLGLNKKRIRWEGHGGNKPVAQNDTENGKQKNRRAEFSISKNPFIDKGAYAETLFEDEN